MEQDLITIGDVATDAFIKLKEASLNCNIHKDDCEICLKFASKIPYESVKVIPAGGNSANVAIGGAKLGLKVASISNIGDDENGQKIIQSLKDYSVETALVKKNIGIASNYNYVLWYEDDRTILVKHEDFRYELPEFAPPKWIFLTSLGENSLDLHHAVSRYLEEHPETKLAFSPGTMQVRAGYEKLSDIYKATEIYFSNKEEAMKILKTTDEDVQKLLTGIKALGPKIVVITNSADGAYVLDKDKIWHSPIFPMETKIIEKTGAGDAFTSAYLVATLLGLPTDKALAWGAVNSSSVIGQVGPHDGLLNKEQIETYLSNPPAKFSVTATLT